MSILTNTGISGRMFQELNQRFDSNVEVTAREDKQNKTYKHDYKYNTDKTEGSLKEKVKSIGKGATYIPVAIAAVVELCISGIAFAFSKLLTLSNSDFTHDMKDACETWAQKNIIALLGSASHALGHITLPFVKSDRTYSKTIAMIMFGTTKFIEDLDWNDETKLVQGAKLIKA